MSRTRGARGSLKLNRTLGESPVTASQHFGNTKKKNVHCFLDFRGGEFFLKWKGHFSFRPFECILSRILIKATDRTLLR